MSKVMGDSGCAKINIKREDFFYYEGGKILANPPPGDEIVITGMAGTFPSSRNINEFKDNLFNKVNMVKPNGRWKYFHPEMPESFGTVPEIDKYDSGFFGVHERQSHSLDTMARILQEKVVEAVFDAGLNPSELEGTRTGVYIGVCSSENEKSWFFDNLTPQTFAITGSERSMIAHRISYFLKLKGPSVIIDAACGSSSFGLETAYQALRLGEIDNAVVAGANLCLHPFITMQFLRLGVLSKDGSCKAFDMQGDGYARSDAFGVVILQRARNAKRIYATMVHAKTNCDGYKEQGITFPSKMAQSKLINDFYEDCNVNKFTLSFLEAHGTGTKIGDTEECATIDRVFTKSRTTPLLIGSVKSNIGHSEPASGLCSIIKCILAMETGYIPPNIHFNRARKELRSIVEGRLKVVVEKTPLKDENDLMGVNNYGFGGSNAHMLLRRNPKKNVKIECEIPRLVCVSGRTEESVIVLFDEIVKNQDNLEYVKLLHEVFRKNIQNHLFRGYLIASTFEDVKRSQEFFSGSEKLLYLAFGDLNHWYAIGKNLIKLPSFSDSIQRIQKNLISKGINIEDIFNNKFYDVDAIPVIGSIAVQLAIVQIINLLDIKPNGIFGCSFGALTTAYCNGLLTLDEAVDCAFIINETIANVNSVRTSLTLKEGQSQTSNYVLNGDGNTLGYFKTSLQTPEIMNILVAQLTKQLSGSEKKNVGNKITTTIDYLVNALEKQSDGEMKINSVVLEVGDIASVETEDISLLPLFKDKSTDYIVQLLEGIGSLYINGFNPHISNLYPQVNFPVSRGTPMISPYIRWNHKREKFVPFYSVDIVRQNKLRTQQYIIELVDSEWAFLVGHKIDGRNLVPETAYIYLVWKCFAAVNDRPLNVTRVCLENCRFIRATEIPRKGRILLVISIQTGSGNFEVTEGDSIVVTGRIRNLQQDEVRITGMEPIEPIISDYLDMDKREVYKELSLRGYNYSGEFQAIEEYSYDSSAGLIKWEENWITFIDNMLQMKMLEYDTRLLYVPMLISKITIAADMHCDLIKKKITNETPVLPVYSDRFAEEIRCGGITISGLVPISVSRKRSLGISVLRKYEFISNSAFLDLQTSVRVNIQIVLENTLMDKLRAVEVIDEYTDKNSKPLMPFIKMAVADELLVQASLKILSSDNLDVDVEVEYQTLEDETDNLLVIASRILTRPEVLKQAFKAIKSNGYIISRESSDFDVQTIKDPNIVILTIHKTPSEVILLLQKRVERKHSRYIEITSPQNFPWLSNLQACLTQNVEDIVLYSEKQTTCGILGLVKCLRREPDNSRVRCVFIMDQVKGFDPNSTCFNDQLKKNMAFNIFKDGQWGTYRLLPLDRPELPEREHCFVEMTKIGDLSSFTWTQGPINRVNLKQYQLLVNVYYSSLNFRDVMIGTGKINTDVVSVKRLEQEFYPGFEYSGKDIKGRRVMGISTDRALSNLLQTDPLLTHVLPDEWTLEEAATVPVAYTTVIYALIMIGQIKKGESILIHSGAGSVGQAALHIALHYKCRVFTTVGTQAKREFLMKTFPQLEEGHIGNSHDETFEQMVYQKTNGRGVDIVLNSFAEDKLIASVRCLAKGGRFLDLGKYDLTNNSFINLLLLRKEAAFHGISLDKIFKESLELKQEMKTMFEEVLKHGAIKPLNRTVFKFNEIEQAFRYMVAGKHTGKVLIQSHRPEEGVVDLPKAQNLQGVARYYCDSQSVYIIVGGLSDIALELTDWLIHRGARKILLTSRKGLSTGYQCSRIRTWRSDGLTVKISTASLENEASCKQIIEEGLQLGPISAIFNLAVAAADDVLENQDEETFLSSLLPKDLGTEYLDKLSRKMCPDLREFVVFSSISSGRGNMEQMANSAMERICEKRKEDGYPALAIEWGAVEEVVSADQMQKGVTDKNKISGILQQLISNCLKILDHLLTQKGSTIVSSIVVAEKN